MPPGGPRGCSGVICTCDSCRHWYALSFTTWGRCRRGGWNCDDPQGCPCGGVYWEPEEFNHDDDNASQ